MDADAHFIGGERTRGRACEGQAGDAPAAGDAIGLHVADSGSGWRRLRGVRAAAQGARRPAGHGRGRRRPGTAGIPSRRWRW